MRHSRLRSLGAAEKPPLDLLPFQVNRRAWLAGRFLAWASVPPGCLACRACAASPTGGGLSDSCPYSALGADDVRALLTPRSRLDRLSGTGLGSLSRDAVARRPIRSRAARSVSAKALTVLRWRQRVVHFSRPIAIAGRGARNDTLHRANRIANTRVAILQSCRTAWPRVSGVQWRSVADGDPHRYRGAATTGGLPSVWGLGTGRCMMCRQSTMASVQSRSRNRSQGRIQIPSNFRLGALSLQAMTERRGSCSSM